MAVNCLTCGHPKWTHYRLFLGCLKRGCSCSHYATKPYTPYHRRKR